MSLLKRFFNQVLSKVFLALVWFYRFALAPFFGGRCRFEPSCSIYAIEALKLHSPIQACRLILRRLSKCHPLGPHGFDPVPDKMEDI